MFELLIDTATELGSIALYKEDSLIYSFSFGHELNHLQKLHPAIESALKDNSIKMEEIQIIGCDIGPGSFTGIRIGVLQPGHLVNWDNI